MIAKTIKYFNNLFKISILILIINPNVYSGPNEIDSLENLFKSPETDSVKVNLTQFQQDSVQAASFYKEAEAMVYINADSAKAKFKIALKWATENKQQKFIADLYKSIAIAHNFYGELDSAMALGIKSFEIYESINDSLGIANVKVFVFSPVYRQRGKFDQAERYANEALLLFKSIDNLEGIGECYNRHAMIHYAKKNYKQALEYTQLEKDILSKMDSEKTIERMAEVLNNIGNLNSKLGNLDQAQESFLESKRLFQKLNKKLAISLLECNIAWNYLSMSKYTEAKKHAYNAYNIAKDLNNYRMLSHASKVMYIINERMGNYVDAFKFQSEYLIFKDSLFDEANSKQLAELSTKYETEIKEREIKLQKSQLAKKEIEIKHQRTQKYVFIGGLVLFAFFGLLIYRSYKQKKKANTLLAMQNEEIVQQKEEITAQRDEIEAQRDLVMNQKEKIEKVNEELTDSINYAKYIQNAILPQADFRGELLPEHFIFFKPKNIVSGDFYWLTKIEEKIIVAAADCTGHGVPGAFMSMLGLSFLNDIVNKEYITHPAVILRRLRKEVINALQQKGEYGEQRDGMDIALCSIDFKNLELQFSGANNPLYLIRDKEKEPVKEAIIYENSEVNLYKIKGDKMPIAIHDRMDKFRMHEIKLLKGDCLYMFSDGFADQFGGNNGKKFKYKPFKELLLANSKKSTKQQLQILDDTFNNWKGNYEQIDDILVIGIKI